MNATYEIALQLREVAADENATVAWKERELDAATATLTFRFHSADDRLDWLVQHGLDVDEVSVWIEAAGRLAAPAPLHLWGDWDQPGADAKAPEVAQGALLAAGRLAAPAPLRLLGVYEDQPGPVVNAPVVAAKTLSG